MADGYPIEAQLANTIEREKKEIKKWRYSRDVLLPHQGQKRESPTAGEVFRQPDLAATLRKLVDTEQLALAAGKNRKEAIYAAYDRFYKGDIAQEIARAVKEEGGLITAEDLANWKVRIEEPVSTTYKGIEVLQADRLDTGARDAPGVEYPRKLDVKSMGYNSSRYIHAILPVDEPRLRRPRLLLRRPLLPT